MTVMWRAFLFAVIAASMVCAQPTHAGLLKDIVTDVLEPPEAPPAPKAQQASAEDPVQKLISQVGGECEDEEMKQRLTKMVEQLRPCMYRNAGTIKPYLIQNDTLNAAATASGLLLMYSGMMKATEGNDPMLAAVVGHELGHIERQHAVRQQWWEVILGIASGKDAGLQVLSSLVLAQRSQRDEFEADKCGLRYMLMAGYDPDGALQLQQKFVELSGSGSGVDSYFSTHPAGPERISRLRAVLPDLLLSWGGKARASGRTTVVPPSAAVACDVLLVGGPRPPSRQGGTPVPSKLTRDLVDLLAKSGQMEPAALPESSDGLEAALCKAADRGDDLLIWCSLATPPGAKGPTRPQVRVYDVPTGLVLTVRTVQGGGPKAFALAVLANRNWRHGGHER